MNVSRDAGEQCRRIKRGNFVGRTSHLMKQEEMAKCTRRIVFEAVRPDELDTTGGRTSPERCGLADVDGLKPASHVFVMRKGECGGELLPELHLHEMTSHACY